jgi:2-polyprenyl-3-methyl-5-hydroxy-6-metoxy-1,4-benzoquinol methylase
LAKRKIGRFCICEVGTKSDDMREATYYAHVNDRPVGLESERCDLADPNQLREGCRFTRHPRGFKIFLSPDKLAACDEQADSGTEEQYIENPFHRRRTELAAELAREAVASAGSVSRILDLGCGRGYVTEAIRQALDGAEVSGLDCSVAAIEYAHGHFPQIDFAVGDACDSPYAPGYFDLVMCNNLWEHVPDPLFLLSRIKRVVKPGGYLLLSTPNRYRLRNLGRILRGKPVVFMSPHHVTEYTIGQVTEQLAYGGFETRRISSTPIWAVGLKAAVAQRVFSRYISLIGSHHQLGATVFYLAQNVVSAAEQRAGMG